MAALLVCSIATALDAAQADGNESWDVNPGGQAAITAAEHDYSPPEHEDKITAYTSMEGPGERVDVRFTMPPPGDYPFVCVFTGDYPFVCVLTGDYVAMQGTLFSVIPEGSTSGTQ